MDWSHMTQVSVHFYCNRVLCECTISILDAVITNRCGAYDSLTPCISSLYWGLGLLMHASGWYLSGAVRYAWIETLLVWLLFCVWVSCVVRQLAAAFFSCDHIYGSVCFGVVLMIFLSEGRQRKSRMKMTGGAPRILSRTEKADRKLGVLPTES